MQWKRMIRLLFVCKTKFYCTSNFNSIHYFIDNKLISNVRFMKWITFLSSWVVYLMSIINTYQRFLSWDREPLAQSYWPHPKKQERNLQWKSSIDPPYLRLSKGHFNVRLIFFVTSITQIFSVWLKHTLLIKSITLLQKFWKVGNSLIA